ncbi:hypothetical protein KYK30_03410 [Shinella yambaruensis]|uniref:Lipoprotein n=1 Tax=Shinella yambaruensis TaxID=415996 RepID=A0ABQ5ZD53_9HYPH|nr:MULTISPECIES: hypothetical protein [Shinella]CAK7256029.1 Lipoprotein [Shinella sp. WSC3-e]MCJ8024124.1 hypothetical protein [Shinella yambaruensis]MCU7978727.1 hypothetical protein [Shinella yambaruensis]MCW5705704.1 hypothetical protein [Shinella sp.]GLR49421.1 hypothetical protein GCM10007923_06260 [Shinella yambaruensis]
MRLLSIVALASASLFITGCVTETSYNRAQEIVRGSPAAKRDGVNKCYAGARRASPARKAEMAKIMNVSPRRDVARIYCQRAFNGIASGRITYSDFRTKSPRFIRVIQGR